MCDGVCGVVYALMCVDLGPAFSIAMFSAAVVYRLIDALAGVSYRKTHALVSATCTFLCFVFLW